MTAVQGAEQPSRQRADAFAACSSVIVRQGWPVWCWTAAAPGSCMGQVEAQVAPLLHPSTAHLQHGSNRGRLVWFHQLSVSPGCPAVQPYSHSVVVHQTRICQLHYGHVQPLVPLSHSPAALLLMQVAWQLADSLLADPTSEDADDSAIRLHIVDHHCCDVAAQGADPVESLASNSCSALVLQLDVLCVPLGCA